MCEITISDLLRTFEPMKKHRKEALLTAAQLFMFYIFPLFAGPTDSMGMVVLILLATFALSAAMGAVTNDKMRFAYPFAAALLFVPSVFIHYNASAFIHTVWYFADSLLGLCLGLLIRWLHRLTKHQPK